MTGNSLAFELAQPYHDQSPTDATYDPQAQSLVWSADTTPTAYYCSYGFLYQSSYCFASRYGCTRSGGAHIGYKCD